MIMAVCDDAVKVGNEVFHCEDGFADGGEDCVALVNNLCVGLRGVGVKVGDATECANDVSPRVVAIASKDGDVVSKVNDINGWPRGVAGTDVDVLHMIPGNTARLCTVCIIPKSLQQGWV